MGWLSGMIVMAAGVTGYLVGRIGSAHRVPEIDPYLQRLATVVDRRPAAPVFDIDSGRRAV